MCTKHKKTVQKNIFEYKAYLRKQTVTDFAAKRYSPKTVLRDREQAFRIVSRVNEKLNVIFDELNVKTRESTRKILGSDELMRIFVRRDKFDLTFSNKFQMSRKRIRKVLRDSVIQSYKNELPVEVILKNVQNAWLNTSEFTKFVSYMSADASIFAEYSRIIDESTTGYFEIVLSENHTHKDICDRHVGIYEIGESVTLPPYHPYCVCCLRTVSDAITALAAVNNRKTANKTASK